MDDSLLALTHQQLKVAQELLATALESNDPSLVRECVAVAIERITLVEELISAVSEEVDRVQSQRDELWRAINADPQRDQPHRVHERDESESKTRKATRLLNRKACGLLIKD